MIQIDEYACKSCGECYKTDVRDIAPYNKSKVKRKYHNKGFCKECQEVIDNEKNRN